MVDTRALRGTVGGLVLFGLLELLTRAELVNPTYLPPASTILFTTGRILTDTEFLAHAGGTLLAWGIGMLVATVLAVPLGLLLGSSRRSYLASTTAIEFLRPMPSVALIPLVILLRGRGLDMKVILIVYASVWPILFNTIYGIREVDPLARETARAYGLGRLAILRKVSLPSAAPFVYTGVRISAAIAVTGLIGLLINAAMVAGERRLFEWHPRVRGTS